MTHKPEETSVPTPLTPAKRIKRLFVTGLVLLVPVALSGWVLLALFNWMDGIFAPRIQQFLDPLFPGFYVPGLGAILTVLLIFTLGWVSSNVLGRRLVAWFERIVGRIPIGGSIYSATKTVMEAVSQDQSEAFKRVVLIEYPRRDLFALAFVTSSGRWPGVHERTADMLMVFVPSTPNPTSGFVLLVPRDQAIDLPISVEAGIRMVISGGIVSPRALGLPASPASG